MPYHFPLLRRLASKSRGVKVQGTFGALIALLRFPDTLAAGVPLRFRIAILKAIEPNLLTL
ncbi:hypothetical protein RsS62_46270 [Rhizobium dioscoreae]|nr:hypothetical protein RsS62_46270 [Rhizobium dioscoreae]